MPADVKQWILHETVSKLEAEAVATYLGATISFNNGLYQAVSGDQSLTQRAKDFIAGYQACCDAIQGAIDTTWDRSK